MTGRIPNHATPFQRMERKLATKRGRSLYGLRARSVEPVFAQIKEGRRVSRFRRRGLGPVSTEWRLLATTHNLLKLWRRQSIAALA